MVLWEITLGAAYLLGLKRSYKLSLRIQRRLVGPNHPKLREFLHRRTRTIFDLACRVHQKIQQRDLEVGRNIGNRVLLWLDRMKPSARIRGSSPPVNQPNGFQSRTMVNQATGFSSPISHHRTIQKPENLGSDKHLFSPLASSCWEQCSWLQNVKIESRNRAIRNYPEPRSIRN